MALVVSSVVVFALVAWVRSAVVLAGLLVVMVAWAAPYLACSFGVSVITGVVGIECSDVMCWLGRRGLMIPTEGVGEFLGRRC